MRVIGIISEYNPFHSGHRYQIEESKRVLGSDSMIVCVMSGNWVQRGDAALCDKWTRAAMALRGGADLILELPTPWAASSAETFATGGVSILDATGFVDTLSFGSECGVLAPLEEAAALLSSPDYSVVLREYLNKGLSFPVARQSAARNLLGETAQCLETPNNNLGVEYLRALARVGSSIQPHTLLRRGSAHDSDTMGQGFASASKLRKELLSGERRSLLPYLSASDLDALSQVGLSSLSFAERAVFARLRSMCAEDFLSLPDCGEGLHHRLARAALEHHTLDELYTAVKSRRYTHARIRRLVLWAFLSITAKDRPASPPYLRVLGMNRRGQSILKEMKRNARLPILTKPAHAKHLSQEAKALFEVEARCTALYDLCRSDFGQRKGKLEYTENPVIL